MATKRAKSPIGRLSFQQQLILLDFFVYIVKSGQHYAFVDWSPTEYVKRRRGEVVRDEIASVSRRVASLVKRELLVRQGRKLSLTDQGRLAVVKRFKGQVPELIRAEQNIRELEQLSERRICLVRTNMVISDTIAGKHEMTWRDDDEKPNPYAVPTVEERERFLQHTFTTLNLLDGQIENEKKQLRELQSEIMVRLIGRVESL